MARDFFLVLVPRRYLFFGSVRLTSWLYLSASYGHRQVYKSWVDNRRNRLGMGVGKNLSFPYRVGVWEG